MPSTFWIPRPTTSSPGERQTHARQTVRSGRLIGHLNLARGYRGGERQTQLLVEGLARRRLPQRLIARAQQPLADRLRPVEGLDLRATSSSLVSAARACRGLTLAHVHDGRSVHAAALARRLYGVPYVITRRVDNPIRQSLFTRRAYRRAAAVVVLSAAIEREVHALDSRIRCTRVPDALSGFVRDEQAVAALKEKYRDRYVIGHIGALDHAHKGQRDLFAVARAVERTHPHWTFVFLGAGVDEAAFRAETADLANVEFAGHVDNVGDYLAVFDAFAFPSLHEGMGSTLLDAMAAGVPIVATRVGGIVDLIRDGENGILVAPAEPEQLAAALMSLHDDRAQAARLSRAGQTTAAGFSAQNMVERYLEIYRPMLPTHFMTESS